MELAYKEDLFMMLSMSMDAEEAIEHTERISNNFKKIYSPKPSTLQPIVGNDTYSYFINRFVDEGGWSGDIYYVSKVFKYVNGEWVLFMSFKDGSSKCKELIQRLKLGGNNVIEY